MRSHIPPMSDGVLLKRTAWGRYSEARPKQTAYKGSWKIAKVTPEIKANPDLLLTHGFQKKGAIPHFTVDELPRPTFGHVAQEPGSNLENCVAWRASLFSVIAPPEQRFKCPKYVRISSLTVG